MYKILALNCLITAYALSVQYLDGIKYGDYQMSITGMLMSVCFLCISRAKVSSSLSRRGGLFDSDFVQPVEKLSKERPLGNIFNFYVLLSVLLQFALHIVTMVYITDLSHSLEEYVILVCMISLADKITRRGPIDLDAKFAPSLLNTAIFLLGLSQQVSTFAINYQGRPFRESIRENKYLYYGLVGASGVAVSGALDLVPEFNRWLQVVEMTVDVRLPRSR
jgi:cation-transporting ATPase 13A1